jgi:hypothetical protein
VEVAASQVVETLLNAEGAPPNALEIAELDAGSI